MRASTFPLHNLTGSEHTFSTGANACWRTDTGRLTQLGSRIQSPRCSLTPQLGGRLLNTNGNPTTSLNRNVYVFTSPLVIMNSITENINEDVFSDSELPADIDPCSPSYRGAQGTRARARRPPPARRYCSRLPATGAPSRG